MRRNGIWDASNDATNALAIGAFPGPRSSARTPATSRRLDDRRLRGALGIPDIVGSLRVDQAWGSAQIARRLHQMRAGYYGNNTTGAGVGAGGTPASRLRATRSAGRSMAGIVINLPWAKGDQFYVEGAYT